jgi:hypothetical protein
MEAPFKAKKTGMAGKKKAPVIAHRGFAGWPCGLMGLMGAT